MWDLEHTDGSGVDSYGEVAQQLRDSARRGPTAGRQLGEESASPLGQLQIGGRLLESAGQQREELDLQSACEKCKVNDGALSMSYISVKFRYSADSSLTIEVCRNHSVQDPRIRNRNPPVLKTYPGTVGFRTFKYDIYQQEMHVYSGLLAL